MRRGGDQQDREHLDEVREPGVGFSNGIAEFALKNPAAVGPQLLDRLLRGDRPARERRRRPGQGLDHALRDEDQRGHDGERQQHVQQRADQVPPEVAQATPLRATSPRITATATQMPTAAETKFCTARPAIWLNDVIVVRRRSTASSYS